MTARRRIARSVLAARRTCALIVAAASLAAVSHADAALAPSGRVAAAQVALRAHGYYAGEVDGLAGPITSRAVRAYQRRAGLAADGVVGPLTRTAFGRLGRPGFGSRTLRRGAIGWDVSYLQFLLRAQGFMPGSVDGRFGRRTEAGVRRFQSAYALEIDGIAGPRTLRALARAARSERGGVLTAIEGWTRAYGLDRRLVLALAWMESGFQVDVTSSSGAWGVLQILPETWSFVEQSLLGEHIPRTGHGNVRIGVAFLSYLLREFDGNTPRALAAWYQGPASVRRDGVFRVSHEFVADVLALRARL
jgi:Putative peptidoglycan binding domain/Transglycosylase SLT domain